MKKFFVDISNSEKSGSWRNLEKCLTKHTSIFSIITARGHSIQTLKAGIKTAILKYISKENLKMFCSDFLEKYNVKVKDKSIGNVLDSYLELCRFYPCSNPEIREKFGCDDISELKSLAFEEFRDYITKYVKDNFGEDMGVKIGFSDDSRGHLNKMVNNILEKEGLFFYNTRDGKKWKY